MSQQSRANLKTYFETGDTPTEAEFINLIDSLLNLIDDDLDDISDGATNKAFTLTEKTKLTGIETGADVNVVDSVNGDTGDVYIKREIALTLFESDASVEVGDGKIAIPIPTNLNGFNLINVLATVHTKGITGSTDVQIRRRRSGSDVDMLSTKITIGDEFYSTDEVINTANDDIATGDNLYIDVDSIHSGTAPLGLSVILIFEKA